MLKCNLISIHTYDTMNCDRPGCGAKATFAYYKKGNGKGNGSSLLACSSNDCGNKWARIKTKPDNKQTN